MVFQGDIRNLVNLQSGSEVVRNEDRRSPPRGFLKKKGGTRGSGGGVPDEGIRWKMRIVVKGDQGRSGGW